MSGEFSATERSVLRELAMRIAEAAALPVMAERRQLCRDINALRTKRPMIMVFPEGSWREIKADWQFQCQGELARTIEDSFRTILWTHQNMDTDIPVEALFYVSKDRRQTGWGLEAQWHFSDQATGARTFKPVLHSRDDLKKLRYPEVIPDEKAWPRSLERYQSLFGDILDVRLVGMKHISFHPAQQYTSLRGLEQAMMDMYENPGLFHEAMAFFEEGHRRLIQQHLEFGLLDLNNDCTYNNTGGLSYSDQLPAKDYSGTVRLKDLWASAEAQEFALVSPEMHEEFVLQYERRLMEPFGLKGYGCCEDLTRKLDMVCAIPGMRRISISPFADVDKCAARLRGDYIFSWKPHPAHIVGRMNESMIREYIRHTVKVCRENGCVLEMSLKDTHTCDGQPDRFTRWTRIAREVVNESL